MDDMPKVIMIVVTSLIILGVGTFAFFTVYSEIGYSTSYTETFNVTDPSVDNTFTVKYFPTSITSVYQFNGIEWTLVDPSFYTNTLKAVTVQAAGMDG